MKRTIYADHNATTPPGPGALAAMGHALETWGNPSSTHRLGRAARELLDASRVTVAATVGTAPSEVVFTSGGSEANTTVLLGSRLASDEFRLLTSAVEHSSVRDAAKFIGERGNAQVETIRIDRNGELDLADFVKRLDTFRPSLVSLMAANNETGVLFPIPEVAAHCSARSIPLHVDAVQAFGKIPNSFIQGADFLSLSAHKVNGPKGVGALVVRNGRKLVSTHFGGSQETKRRGGTENVVGIAGFAGACRDLDPEAVLRPMEALRDHFEEKLTRALDDITINGAGAERLPNTTNLRVPGIPAEVLLGALDLDGVCVSAGSACSSGSLTPSHVLLAMGLGPQEARECLRISWGRGSTVDEVDTVATLVIHHVSRIRSRKRL